MESKSLTSVPTSRIETRREEQSHSSECKSGNYGSLISLNLMKENHELPVRQTSGRKRSPKREKSITPVGSKSKTTKTSSGVQRKYIPSIVLFIDKNLRNA